MLTEADLKTIQIDIESRYDVQMYPKRSTYQKGLIQFYADKNFLSKKQINCIKYPKYPIRGI